MIAIETPVNITPKARMEDMLKSPTQENMRTTNSPKASCPMYVTRKHKNYQLLIGPVPIMSYI